MISRILLALTVLLMSCQSQTIYKSNTSHYSTSGLNAAQIEKNKKKKRQEKKNKAPMREPVDTVDALELKQESSKNDLKLGDNSGNEQEELIILNDIEKKLITCFYQWDYMFYAVAHRKKEKSKSSFELKHAKDLDLVINNFTRTIIEDAIFNASEYIYSKSELSEDIYLMLSGEVRDGFDDCLLKSNLENTDLLKETLSLAELYTTVALVKDAGGNRQLLNELLEYWNITIDKKIIDEVYINTDFNHNEYREALWVSTIREYYSATIDMVDI